MPTNTHIHEAKVIRDAEFVQTVEAAMMQVALEIAQESDTTVGYQNRRDLAKAVIRNPADRERFAEMFAWWAMHNTTIRGQVFQPTLTDPVTPDNIDGATLRGLIEQAWNFAANVDE